MSAPYLCASRTASRAWSAPLITPTHGPVSGKRPWRYPPSSQCPPVAPMAWTETSILGPAIFPLAIALRRPTSIESREPTSRTVVNPAISVTRAFTLASRACSATVFCNLSSVACFQSSEYMPVRCVCASMNPGSSVASPRSITSAPAGTLAVGPAAVILPSATTTTPGFTSASPLPSYIRAAFRTIVLFAGVALLACPWPDVAAIRHSRTTPDILRFISVILSLCRKPKRRR